MAKDKINHPSHYKGFKVEAWDCVRTFDFFTGNVVKYLMRAPFKGFPAEDFEKAASYVAYLNTRPGLPAPSGRHLLEQRERPLLQKSLRTDQGQARHVMDPRQIREGDGADETRGV